MNRPEFRTNKLRASNVFRSPFAWKASQKALFSFVEKSFVVSCRILEKRPEFGVMGKLMREALHLGQPAACLFVRFPVYRGKLSTL
jgi:hypothetical protein